MTRVYDELIDFIVRGTTREAVAEWTPSEEAKARVWDLISREKDGRITGEERDELNHYMELEHVMRLAKARARQPRE